MTSPSPDPLPVRECPVRGGYTPLYGPEFARNPAAVYALLRERHGPIAPVELAPGVPAHLVLGYEAALEVMREPTTFPRDPRRWEARLPPDCLVLPMMGTGRTACSPTARCIPGCAARSPTASTASTRTCCAATSKPLPERC